MSRKWIGVAAGLLAILAIGANTASAGGGCVDGKLKALGKKEASLLKCQAKNAAKPDTAKLAACESKASGKFGPACSAAGVCSGDCTTCENLADACESNVSAAITDSAKLKAASKLAKGELKCYTKAAAKALPVDTVKCLPKAQSKFSAAGGTAGEQNTVETNCVDTVVTTDGGGSPPTGNVTAICGGGGGGGTTTTTTMPAATCQAIVTGNPISGTYKITSITGPQKICTQNAANQAKAFHACSSDADCGAVGADLSCQQPPWVTLGGLSQPTPLGATTTFTVTEAAAPACEHAACITCGSPLVTCPGLPACTTANCNGHLSNQCCNNPGFVLPSLFIAGVNACTRLDQNGSGSGAVNSSKDGAGHNTGHNVVRKVGDTSHPDGGGSACAYDSPADADNCATADGDTKGLVFRTVGTAACVGHCSTATTTPCTGNDHCPSGQTCVAVPCGSDADGIHVRLSTPGLSTTWQPSPASPGGAVADCTCGTGSDMTMCGKYHNGTLLTQIQLNAEPSTAGAVGAFSDHNADGCAIGTFGSQGLSSASPAGPISTVGADAQKPIPYGGTGLRNSAIGIAFSNVSGEGDIGFASVTDNSGPTVVATQACDSVPVAPPVGCPEPAGP